MTRLQNILNDGGCVKIWSGANACNKIRYEVWARDGLAFIISDNRFDEQLEMMVGLYEEWDAVNKARRLCGLPAEI